jgi:hypothetical protein
MVDAGSAPDNLTTLSDLGSAAPAAPWQLLGEERKSRWSIRVTGGKVGYRDQRALLQRGSDVLRPRDFWMIALGCQSAPWPKSRSPGHIPILAPPQLQAGEGA